MQHHAPLIKTPVKSRKDTSRAPSVPVITQSLIMIRADIKDKMEWLHQNIISGSGFATHKECDFHPLTFHSGLLTAPQERQHQHRRAKKKTNKTTVKGSVSLSVWSVIGLLSASPTEQLPRTRGFATHRKAARDASHRCPCCAQRPGATAAPPSTPRHGGRSLPTCSAHEYQYHTSPPDKRAFWERGVCIRDLNQFHQLFWFFFHSQIQVNLRNRDSTSPKGDGQQSSPSWVTAALTKPEQWGQIPRARDNSTTRHPQASLAWEGIYPDRFKNKMMCLKFAVEQPRRETGEHRRTSLVVSW